MTSRSSASSSMAESAGASRRILVRRWGQLLLGLFFYGIAVALLIQANVGLDPWTVFAQGLEVQTGLSIGLIVVLIGFGVLLLWIPIKQKPGIGTVLNVLLIGPVLDLAMLVIETPDQLWAQWLMFAGGLALLAIATGLYIGARFGPGPRDGLMTGAHARFGWKIWKVRTGVEVTVLAIGWLLGGTVGFGTIAFALLIGPMVGVTLPLLRVPEPTRPPAPVPS
ncbi:YczE/YyaS/YitT family protein [Microcella frigidaquae]|uniref:Putative membrane protein YczE n=1 Tax=Microcella frigidaquae TaxID=424758 RepID=A0A840XNJ7_9MICO|nr:hypothetical protein [Microcella frigidaquae]MBB5618178.1 putative membrane protein YczE [Microcella frigidaquae]